MTSNRLARIQGDLVQDHVTGHFAGERAHRAQLVSLAPSDAMEFDVLTITALYADLLGEIVDGRERIDTISRLAIAAAIWAHQGIPIDTVIDAFHEGRRRCTDLVFSPGALPDRGTVVDRYAKATAISDRIFATVASSYLRENHKSAPDSLSAGRGLTAALLAGQPATPIARTCGIEISSAYFVLALSISAVPAADNFQGSKSLVGSLRAVQDVLARCYGERVLSSLSVVGGIVLISADSAVDGELDALVAALSRAAGAVVMATAVLSATQEIPDAVRRANELLDMVGRLGCVAGLYRFADLALEYQLTRPGPGLHGLSCLLTPLDESPDLYETLCVHIANNMNRKRTARRLNVHANTVDNRLRRIGQLTGIDASQPLGLWRLRAAMIARSYTTTTVSSVKPDAKINDHTAVPNWLHRSQVAGRSGS